MARKGAMKKDPPKREQKPSNRQASPPKQTTPSQQTRQQPQVSPEQQSQQQTQPVTSANRPPSKWTRTGPGTYKDQYGNVLKGQKVAPKKDMSQRGQKPPTPSPPPGPANEPPPGVPFEQLTPVQQMEEVGDVAGQIGINMGNISAGFNPETFQQQYDPVFSQEMERARQNVLSQFDRRNQQQFQQQRLNLQQQIAERGLDPASPAAQELTRQQNERETLAQQEAMSAAEQAAQGVQTEMYRQATGTAMMPGEIFGQYQGPLLAQYQGQMQARENELQRQFDEAMRKGDRASAERIARMSRGGGGGGGGGQQGPTLYERMQAGQLSTGYGQGAQPNPWAAVGQGIAAGAGGQITSNLNRR